MNIQEELIGLDAAVNQVSNGLDRVDDPYADGFYFISDRLLEAVQSLREQTDRCLQAV